MKKLILALVAGSLLVFNSCTKTGPQGPVGPQGPTGATGATGPAGPQGNANVIGSAPFTIVNWQLSNGMYYASFTDADITSDVASGGIVQMFREYNTNNWSPLPDINGPTSIVFDFTTGAFNIYVQNSDGTTPTYPGSITFRTVIITPSQRQAHPNTNWKNYNEAMRVLNSVSMPVSAQ